MGAGQSSLMATICACLRKIGRRTGENHEGEEATIPVSQVFVAEARAKAIAIDKDEGEGEEEECPTCLEVFDSSNPAVMAKCGHRFHYQCILAWHQRKPTCPVCFRKMVCSEPL